MTTTTPTTTDARYVIEVTLNGHPEPAAMAKRSDTAKKRFAATREAYPNAAVRLVDTKDGSTIDEFTPKAKPKASGEPVVVEPSRPADSESREIREAGWMRQAVMDQIEKEGWSRRQLSIKAFGERAKEKDGKTTMVPANPTILVSFLGKEGEELDHDSLADIKMSSLERLFDALGLDIVPKQ